MKKGIAILLLCLIVAVLSYAVWKFVFPHDKAIDLARIESLISEGTIEAAIDGERVSFIDGTFTSQTVADSSDAASVLNSASALFGDSFHADAEDFISQPYDDGAFQANYYRYSPSVNGVPVLGSQLILSADRDSNVTALFSSYVPEIEKVDTVATITADEASDIAVTELLNSDAMSDFIDSLTDETIAREDVIAALKSVMNAASDLIIYAVDDSESPRLVYAVSVDNILDDESIERDYEVIDPDENPNIAPMPIVSETYYIAANGKGSGNIIKTVSNFEAAGWQRDTYRPQESSKNSDKEINVERNGDRIRLHDTERNISIYYAMQLAWFYNTAGLVPMPMFYLPVYIKGDMVTADTNSEVPENAFMAQYNVAQAYDFYKSLGRVSYDNKGTLIPVLLGYESADNAQWNPNRKRIEIKSSGGYENAMDVIGHEYTHAVLDSIGLSLVTEINHALHEGYADIMGCLIEGRSGDDKWLFGEDSGLIRNLKNPQSPIWYPQANNGKSNKLISTPDPDSEIIMHYPNTMSEYEKTFGRIKGEEVAKGYALGSILGHAVYFMMSDDRTSSIPDTPASAPKNYATPKKTWAAIFYDSMSKLPAATKLLDARRIIIETAHKHDFTSEEVQAIREAFNAVEIYDAEFDKTVISTLNGRIIDQQTGNPVEGASIELVKKSNGESVTLVTTDADGRFTTPDIQMTIAAQSIMFAVRVATSDLRNTSHGMNLSEGDKTFLSDSYRILVKKPGYADQEILSPNLLLEVTATDSEHYLYNIPDVEISLREPEPVVIDSLQELDSLDRFLADFDFGFAYGADEYDFTDEAITSQVNVINPIMYAFSPGYKPYEWRRVPKSRQMSE